MDKHANNKHTKLTKGVLELKTAWYFCYSKKKRKKKGGAGGAKAEALEREKMSQSPIDFFLIRFMVKNPLLQLTPSATAHLLQASAEWDPAHSPHALVTAFRTTPTPSITHPPSLRHLLTHPHPCHFLQITCTEISGSTMYSNLVWIMCCSLAFLKWYRSLYWTSTLASKLSSVRGALSGLGQAWPPHFPSRSRLLKTCSPSSPHVSISKSYRGWGWGRGFVFVQYGQKQVLIIVDMILSWKNILWFQRVSEHVLELRALWDVWVKGMHYSFWLCGDKKQNIFYTFYHSDAHKSILVLFISSYWLVHALVRCRVHHGSRPALCLLKKGGGGGPGRGSL